MASTDWRADAACGNHPHLDWFDLDCNLQQTLAVCLTCTVQSQCLDIAIEHRYIEGIWGGLHGKRLYDAVLGRRKQRTVHA